MIGIKRLVRLIGGPMDGYCDIECHDEKHFLRPFPHHRRECGVHESLWPVYQRGGEDYFVFSHCELLTKDGF